MHKKIQVVSKKWIIPRKKKTYVAVPSHTNAMPLIIILRDILEVGKTNKEIKRIMALGLVKLNGKIIKDEKQPASLFDIITLGEKRYKVDLAKSGKYKIEETKDDEKIRKIIGKKMTKKGLQINFNDGYNLISKEKANSGDSAIIKDGKMNILKLENNAKVLILEGKHAGEAGKVKSIGERFVKVSLQGKDVETVKKFIMVVK